MFDSSTPRLQGAFSPPQLSTGQPPCQTGRVHHLRSTRAIMCYAQGFESPTCPHRWLQITTTCIPGWGFSKAHYPIPHEFKTNTSLLGGTMHFEVAPPHICPVCDRHNMYDGNMIRMVVGQQSSAWDMAPCKRVRLANNPARVYADRPPLYSAPLLVRGGPATVQSGSVPMSPAALIGLNRGEARAQGLMNPRVRSDGGVEYNTSARGRATGVVKARVRPDGVWQYKIRTRAGRSCCNVM